MWAYADKSYDLEIHPPQTSWMIARCAGLLPSTSTSTSTTTTATATRGVHSPGREVRGVVTTKHIYHVAEAKRSEFPRRFDLEGVCRTIAAQCKSMGVAVVADEEEARNRFPESVKE